MSEQTVQEIVEKLLARMRKTASGEMVAFDKLHVAEVLVAHLTAEGQALREERDGQAEVIKGNGVVRVELLHRLEKAESQLTTLTKERDNAEEQSAYWQRAGVEIENEYRAQLATLKEQANSGYYGREWGRVVAEKNELTSQLTTLHAAHERLIEKWRETATIVLNAPPFGFDPTTARALLKCADELASLK